MANQGSAAWTNAAPEGPSEESDSEQAPDQEESIAASSGEPPFISSRRATEFAAAVAEPLQTGGKTPPDQADGAKRGRRTARQKKLQQTVAEKAFPDSETQTAVAEVKPLKADTTGREQPKIEKNPARARRRAVEI